MTFHPVPKEQVFRCQRLLDLAADAPHCFSCYAQNDKDGTVVAAHCNELWAGKGMGIKAHDVPAYVCGDCHDAIDGRTRRELLPEDRVMIFLRAQYLTMVWLLKTGHLIVKRHL